MTGVTGPGSELEKARERLNVSRREVADALNLPIRVIEALETDDYERLPPSVFSRGYLRSYARLLELDPAALTATYPLPEPAVEASEIDAPPSGPRTGTLALIAGIALLIVVIVVVVAVVSGGRDASSSPPPSPGSEIGEPLVPMGSDTTTPADVVGFVDAADVEAPAAEAAAEPGFDARVEPVEPAAATGMRSAGPREAPDEVVEVEIDDEDEADVPRVPAAAPEGAPSTRPVSAAPVEGDAPDAGPGDVAASDSRRITEFGDDVLEFSFSDDCWVEVKTVDGESLYSNLNRAGRSISLIGRGPFRVLLGYAPGVALSYNGERVPLDRYTRNNVASLVVGR